MSVNKPKKSKFRVHYMRHTKAKSCKNKLNSADCGVQAIRPGVITFKQLSAIVDQVRSIARQLKCSNSYRLFCLLHPQHAITSKPIGQRMGSGKGPISDMGQRIKTGKILFEVAGSDVFVQRSVKIIGSSLSMKVQSVWRYA